MRLPPQVAAVIRGASHVPMRTTASDGAWASGTTESINCQSGQVLCSCLNNGYACCPSNQCHVDSGGTGLCLCGSAKS